MGSFINLIMKPIARDKRTINILLQIEKLASAGVPVYLWGEDGVGKDFFAAYLHEVSGRKGPFVRVGAYNLKKELAEVQLFGCKRGAFSDAHEDREGFLKKADGGTLYLDMLEEMDMEVQKSLFGAVESGEFLPLGSTTPERSDFRVIASGRFPLERAVKEGKILEKFMHFFTFSLEIPPLRERKEDIVPLAREFASGRIAIPGEVASALRSYRWYGNVRELKNFVEREIALGKEELGVPSISSVYLEEELKEKASDLPSLEEMEVWYIKRVLSIFNGNKTRAAKALGITRKTLLRKLKK